MHARTEAPRKVRAAVVGAGHLGSAHARVYGSMSDVDLVAVVDIDEGAARRAAEPVGARALADYRGVPGDVEAVSVVVPTAAHREVAEFFLERGASVLVEKPMAPSSGEARHMLEVASRAKGILQVGHIERFNPAVRAARAHVDRPRFIECRRVAPFSFRSKDVSVVLDLMIHDLDIIRWIVGERPVRIDAVGTPVLMKDREDIANARIVFERGCVADITASRVAAKVERALRIFQDMCYISIDTATPRARVFRPSAKFASGAIDPAMIASADLDDPREFLFREIVRIEELELPADRPLDAELGSFVESVREGRPPAVDGSEGLGAIELAEMVLQGIRESARRP